LSLNRLNAAPLTEAAALLDGLYEHSPWIAEAALASRPFTTLADLKQAMAQAVRQAGRDRQLALIRAHPELAGKAMLAGALTSGSAHEQLTSGLTHCSPEELQTLHALNNEYTARFGWPFVLAVRGPSGHGLTRAEIIVSLRQRLVSTPQVEMDECLKQIDRIAEIRLHDRMGLSGESS
jgi:N-carbamoyl-L-amino-acid hydrolase